MRFQTEMTVTGPFRHPVQMLADQEYDGHTSIHDGDTAASLGLAGAPIEAPTHFSQIDPLATLVWGDRWFERGCVSSHFRTMVVEGETVQASLSLGDDRDGGPARIEAHKADGTPVLAGTAAVDADPDTTELGVRLSSLGDPGPLHVIDRLEIGMREEGITVSVDFDHPNGSGYPFTLAQKLAGITEPHPWYSAEGAASSPWERPVLPFEMVSVLAHKHHATWPVRTPSLGLFLDMEIRMISGPVFTGQPYLLEREIVGLSQSRRTESYWTRTRLTDADSGQLTAEVLLHSGVFKESYPGYPSAAGTA